MQHLKFASGVIDSGIGNFGADLNLVEDAFSSAGDFAGSTFENSQNLVDAANKSGFKLEDTGFSFGGLIQNIGTGFVDFTKDILQTGAVLLQSGAVDKALDVADRVSASPTERLERDTKLQDLQKTNVALQTALVAERQRTQESKGTSFSDVLKKNAVPIAIGGSVLLGLVLLRK